MFSKTSVSNFLNGKRVENAKAPIFLTFRSSNILIISTVSLAVFTVRLSSLFSCVYLLTLFHQDVFLYSVVIPILPYTLGSRANVQKQDIQRWSSVFLSVYGAALGAGSLFFGYFADRTTSRRMPLLLGLFALAGSTVMLCLGNSLSMLLAGRILQGLSASIVWTVGLALMSDTVPEEEIGQAMGYIAMAYSVASVVGPLLGGVVYEHAGYYAVFAMGFAIIGLDICLRLIMIEKKLAEQWTTANEEGVIMDSPIDNSVIRESSTCEIQRSLPVAIESKEKDVETASPTQSEKSNTKSSKLPPIITLLRHPRLLAALFGCFVQSTSLAAFEATLPLFVKDTFKWSPTAAGLIFICLVIPALFSPVIGHMSDRYGSRVITTTGLIGAVPFWVLLRLVTHNSIRQKVLLCALITIIGTCVTLVASPLMAEIDHILTMEEKMRPGILGKRGAAAQGFGLFNFAFACGSLVGPLWAGFVLEKAGWGTMGWSLGLLSGVAAFVTLVWTGGRIKLRNRRGEPAV